MTADTLSLGGPGPGCSRLRLRRLEIGEIRNGEAAELRAHVAGCLRCQTTQGELARERAELHRALPFEQFAAGVAERLVERAPISRRQWLWRAAAPLAAAAAIAVVALPLLRAPPSDSTHRNRTKGGAGASLFVKDGATQHELAAGEVVAARAQLLLSLRPAGQKYAAAALWEKDAVSMLYIGEARPGPLPTAFEWDGHGRAVVVVRYGDQPVGANAFVAELQKNGPGTETAVSWILPIERP